MRRDEQGTQRDEKSKSEAVRECGDVQNDLTVMNTNVGNASGLGKRGIQRYEGTKVQDRATRSSKDEKSESKAMRERIDEREDDKREVRNKTGAIDKHTKTKRRAD
jgi:hypothetical protein